MVTRSGQTLLFCNRKISFSTRRENKQHNNQPSISYNKNYKIHRTMSSESLAVDPCSLIQTTPVLPFPNGTDLVRKVEHLTLLKIVLDAIKDNNSLKDLKVENNIARGLQKKNGWTVLWSVLCNENEGELRGYSFFKLKETSDTSRIITRFRQSIERILSQCKKAKQIDFGEHEVHKTVIKEGAELFDLMQSKKDHFKQAQTISRAHHLSEQQEMERNEVSFGLVPNSMNGNEGNNINHEAALVVYQGNSSSNNNNNNNNSNSNGNSSNSNNNNNNSWNRNQRIIDAVPSTEGLKELVTGLQRTGPGPYVHLKQ